MEQVQKDYRIIRMAVILAVMAIVATLGGLLIPDLYRDHPYIVAQWNGQDFATLIIGVPALLIAAVLHRRFEMRLLLAGVLAYFVYSYAFYGFVARFNDLYLLHVAILSVAFFTLVFQLDQLRPANFRIGTLSRAAVRTSAVFLLAVASVLTVIWMQEILSHILVEGYRSSLPDGEPGTIIFTLDLGFYIPVSVYAAIAAWRNRYWGLLLTGVSLVMTALVGFSLMGMTAGLILADMPTETGLAVFWLLLGLSAAVLSIWYLRTIRLEWALQEEPPAPGSEQRKRRQERAAVRI